MLRFVAATFLLLCSSLATAATYVYQGMNYESVIGTNYTTSMRLTGSFTTAAALPGSLLNQDIGPTGLNLVQSWSFNDGVNTYTPANSYIVPIPGGGFQVSTGADGSITAALIGIFSPLPAPAHSLGTPISGFQIISGGGDLAAIGAPCVTLAGSYCAGADGSAAAGGLAETSVAGPFALAPPSPIPTLTEWALLILSVLLALGATVPLRRLRH